MELSIRHIGHSPVKASNIIELTVVSDNTTLVETVTDLKGNADENLIMALREIADDLESQNRLIAEGK
jgi:hypothetical protein